MIGNQIGQWAGGAATTTLGGLQTTYGLYLQSKNKRPQYEIPPEIAQNLTQAQAMALEGMPEESRQIAINNLRQAYSTGLAQAGTRKGGLAGVANLYQGVQQGYQQLAAQDAQQRLANQQRLMQQRQVMADYRGQEFQLNKLNPYYEKQAQAQALMGAGMQNISQGLQSGNTGTVDWGGAKKNAPIVDQGTQNIYAQQPQAYQMSPYQFQSQNVTPNPYAGQQELNLTPSYPSAPNYGYDALEQYVNIQ